MSARPRLDVLWIDDFTAGDPLFTQSLARTLVARPVANRVLIVHGAGDGAVRLLQSRAIDVEERDGLPFAADPQAAELIERAYREATKEITAVLTEFGVPAVGIQGSDRGLIRIREGVAIAEDVSWLRTVLSAGSILAVSSLVRAEAGPQPVAVGAAVESLVSRLGQSDLAICLFSGDRRKIESLKPRERLEGLRENLFLADYQAARRLTAGGFSLYLCAPRTLYDDDARARIPIFAENDVKNREF